MTGWRAESDVRDWHWDRSASCLLPFLRSWSGEEK
ncbi:MAG: hypothetical protein K0S86_5073, partial [Geminicoccaceae bacterium]|nr:hypothetical protein [Geminicoccaceae bacterium]